MIISTDAEKAIDKIQHPCMIHSKDIYDRKESEGAQSCPTLWDPVDYSLTGSSVHGIFQARILEWLGMPSFRESF